MRRAAVPVAFVASFALITPLGVVITPSPLLQAPLGAAARPFLRVAAVPPPPERSLQQMAISRPATQAARRLMQAAGATPALAQLIPGGATISTHYGMPLESRAETNRLTLKSMVRSGKPPVAVRPEPARPARPVASSAQNGRVGSVPRAALDRQPPPVSSPAELGPRALGVPASSGTAPKIHPREQADTQPTTHVVSAGQTLSKIAMAYGVTVDDLRSENGLRENAVITPGQRLAIPAPAPSRPSAVSRIRSGKTPSESLMIDAAILKRSGPFVWPTRGVITSRFGWRRYRRHHEGIDLASPHGTPMYATRTGVVSYSGWRNGYGQVVYIDHGGGLETVYGHASELLVAANQKVKRGQLIARVGCTGACTGSHVHFEVRINGVAVDPLRYLR